MPPAKRLDEYRAKRDFGQTSEPDGDGSRPAAGDQPLPRFVIQEHHATRLHWDLRLEHEGTLASWAVPNGIPFDPDENRLAVQTEDHPLEYLRFHGEIPAGNYGAGSMTIWDSGVYELHKWEPRKVEVTFHGERLQGRYGLFPIGRATEPEARDWMIHRMDSPAAAGRTPMPDLIPPMLAGAGRIPADEDRWSFEIKWDGVRAVAYVKPGRLRVLARSGNDITAGYPELRTLLAGTGMRELVLDGEIVAFGPEGRPSFSLLQRRMHVKNESAVRRLAKEVPVVYSVFDLLWADGRSLTGAPYEERRRLLEDIGLGGASCRVPAAYVGNGSRLLAATAQQGLEGVVAKRLGSTYEPGRRSSAWVKVKNRQRQELVIAGWLPGSGRRDTTIGALLMGYYLPGGELRFAGRVGTGFTDEVLRNLRERLSPLRRKGSPFTGEANLPRAAVFTEPTLVAEVEFVEWTPDGIMRAPAYKGLRDDKAARDVVREDVSPEAGSGPDEDEAARDVVREDVSPEAGTGPDDDEAARDVVREDVSPEAGTGPEDDEAARDGVRKDGSPEAGSGPDDDLGPRGTRRSRGSANPRGSSPKINSSEEPAPRDSGVASVAGEPPPPSEDEGPAAIFNEVRRLPGGGLEVVAENRRLRLTNWDKVLYPATGFTKGDLISFYARVAPTLLPHLRDRALTLKRYPNGVEAEYFYEKQAPSHRPKWVQTARVGSVDYTLCQDLPTQVWLANLADIELHTSLSLASAPEVPRMVVFDLDPGPPAGLVECSRVAMVLRGLFSQLGLETVVKTSGNKGIQVYIPLNDPDASYEQTKPFARRIAEMLEGRLPDLVVSRMTKRIRGGRVLVDWSQNDVSKTTVNVYSVRARQREAVSTPLDWDEVERCAADGDPRSLVFPPPAVLDRVAEFGDLFAPALVLEQRLPV